MTKKIEKVKKQKYQQNFEAAVLVTLKISVMETNKAFKGRQEIMQY